MKNSIFRKTSLEKISSPEQIDDYMKVTSPSMWLVFAAIIFILIAVFAWSITGQIEGHLFDGEQVVSEEIAPIELLLE